MREAGATSPSAAPPPGSSRPRQRIGLGTSAPNIHPRQRIRTWDAGPNLPHPEVRARTALQISCFALRASLEGRTAPSPQATTCHAYVTGACPRASLYAAGDQFRGGEWLSTSAI